MTAYYVLVGDFRPEADSGKRSGWAFTWPKYDAGPAAFRATLEALKRAVPSRDRSFDPASKTWWVREGYDLSDVFSNWRDEIDKVNSQLTLF